MPPVPGIGHNTPPRDDDQVVTLKAWAELNAISLRTARRLLAEGNGPAIVQLTSRRIGVRLRDNKEWQWARLRGPADRRRPDEREETPAPIPEISTA